MLSPGLPVLGCREHVAGWCSPTGQCTVRADSRRPLAIPGKAAEDWGSCLGTENVGLGCCQLSEGLSSRKGVRPALCRVSLGAGEGRTLGWSRRWRPLLCRRTQRGRQHSRSGMGRLLLLSGGVTPPPAQSSDLLVLACPPFQGLGSCCSLCLQSSFLKMATWFISSPSSSVCSDITFSGSLAAAFKTVPRHPRHPWNFSCPPCFLRPYASHPLACLRLRLVCSPPGPVGGNVSSVLHSCGQQGLRNMAG